MLVQSVPEVVRNKALAAGAAAWLDELPGLVADLEREWSISVGRTYSGGTEAFVAEATLDDGSDAVLKLLIPRASDAMDAVSNEITALRLANGEELLDGDAQERAGWLAERTGLDATAIWEWGVIERVSTGLLCTSIDLQPIGREMLALADRVTSRLKKDA